MELTINLLVLRCKDVVATRHFYEQLGLVFADEKHGTGPQHYSWESAGFVLELYPEAGAQASENVRLGFSTPSLEEVAIAIRHGSDVTVLKPPHASAGPLIMVLQDPDGRKVEISQALHR